jgi:hypothetical protein
MQYGYLDAVLLNRRYLLFLVNEQIPIDIFIHLASHHIQNVSPHSPLSCGGRLADVYNHIFERYVSTS